MEINSSTSERKPLLVFTGTPGVRGPLCGDVELMSTTGCSVRPASAQGAMINHDYGEKLYRHDILVKDTHTFSTNKQTMGKQTNKQKTNTRNLFIGFC